MKKNLLIIYKPTKLKKEMTDDTHTYYDISIFNNDTSGDMPVQLKFTEQRSGGALVDNPSDYYLSIVRFEIDSPSVVAYLYPPSTTRYVKRPNIQAVLE